MSPTPSDRIPLAWLPLAALLVGLAVWWTPLGTLLSRPALDWQLRLLEPARAPAGVIEVDIDDASLATLRPILGPWPFRRDVYALVIDQLREAGAVAVAINLLLADPKDGDDALARAIAAPGAPVVLAAAGLRFASGQGGVVEQPPREATVDLQPALVWPAIALPAPTLWAADGALPRTGVITTPLDTDGRLRWQPLWHAADGRRLPNFALAVWQAVNDGAEPPAWSTDARLRVAVPFGPASAPATLPPRLPFASIAGPAFGMASPADLRQQVAGQVVFIGSSALLADSVMTVSGQATGTSVLAQTYVALRDGRLIRPSRTWAEALLLAIALIPTLLTWWRGQTSMRRDGAAAAAAVAAILAGGLALLYGQRMATPWAGALACVATGLLLSVVAHLLLQNRIQRRLVQERAAAAAANRAKSEFLANVSHEIRTPMNALLGVADLLSESELTPTQRRHVQVFREAGHSLHALINDLLDLSKIEAGRLELNAAAFSLRRMLDGLMDLQRPRAQQKGLQLELDTAPDLPDGVSGDRVRLEQALNNLLGNAIKFTHTGEVRLSAAPAPEAGPGMLRFTVADSGIGIARSKLESVFDPFVQADGSVTRHYGGTGLGLSITRSVVQLMGGRVEVSSEPAAGSVFTVTVPLPECVMEAAAPAPGTVPASTVMAARPTVLLAEDNEVNAYIFEAMLESLHLRIDVAPNGPTALAMARQKRYDIVFMDMQMPGMDGLSVTRELRRHEAETGRPRMPIIALTANAYDADQQDSAAAGCDQHIAKPFAKEQLIAAMARFVPGSAPDEAASPAERPDVRMAAPTGLALNIDAALARVGGDDVHLRRVLDHAAVFIENWPRDFDARLLQGRGDLTHQLTDDLRRIAASVGADSLSAAAARLQASMAASPTSEPQATALARLRTEIGPVIVALTRR